MQYGDELGLERSWDNEDSAKHQEEVVENLEPYDIFCCLSMSLLASEELQISDCQELAATLQFSSSMAQTLGNALRLEWDGTNNPADEGVAEDDEIQSEVMAKLQHSNERWLEWDGTNNPADEGTVEDDEIQLKKNLEYLSIEKELQTELTSLESLEIKNCPNFRSFLDEKCQSPNLKSLVFFNCRSLKSLQWMQSFKSLQSLYVNNCQELESLPEEGLPSSLVILCISFCNKINPLKKWKLFELKSLYQFKIEGGCLNLESFPEEGLLPTNLNSLRISGLSDLTSLDGKGLQSLTFLRTLEINHCNKLDSLPENGLPSSLSSLSITNCSRLNRSLLCRKGKDWFKIAHISSIHIDEVSDKYNCLSNSATGMDHCFAFCELVPLSQCAMRLLKIVKTVITDPEVVWC
ncbi:hypothetical protein PTKIN_Ptkin16aG0017900 [Pterospermum kingtungense]